MPILTDVFRVGEFGEDGLEELACEGRRSAKDLREGGFDYKAALTPEIRAAAPLRIR